jgi:hypothetical protein
VAPGALQERSSVSYQLSSVDGQRAIQTSFPLRQYSKALGSLRRYLSNAKDLDLNIILICALIHISIGVIQNIYAHAVVHLEKSLQLLLPAFSMDGILINIPLRYPLLLDMDGDIRYLIGYPLDVTVRHMYAAAAASALTTEAQRL